MKKDLTEYRGSCSGHRKAHLLGMITKEGGGIQESRWPGEVDVTREVGRACQPFCGAGKWQRLFDVNGLGSALGEVGSCLSWILRIHGEFP